MTNLHQVLDELYALDPSLRDRESELVPLLKALMRHRPTDEIDEAFVARLRTQLAAAPAPRLAWFRSWMLAVPAIMLAVAIALPQLFPLDSLDDSMEQPGRVQISLLNASAFGELSGNANAAPLGSESSRSATPSFAQSVGSDTTAIDSKMIAPGEPYPGSTTYQYVFDGTLADLASSGTVYRKTMGLRIPSSLANSLAADLGGIDLSGLKNLEAQYLTVRNDRYSISIDPLYGSIFINDNKGYSSTGSPLSASDLPDAETIVSLARAFVEQFGIDLAAYGTPTIDHSVMATLAGTGDTAYVPEYATVNWPLTVNGVSVYNADGSGYGLSVTVNLRTSSGISANINAMSSAEASTYTLETDAAAILDVIRQGGLYNWQPENAEKTVDIKLGEPAIVLMPHSTWNDRTGRNDELFVPAISFPIADAGGESLYRTAVVIPLVESILEAAAVEPIYRMFEEDAATSEMNK